MPCKPNILIVDDHLTFRQGLATIITAENIATVVGEASDGKVFLELLRHLSPDMVLMDIQMPNMNGLEATRQALALFPDLKIIALSMFDDEEYQVKMVSLGVKGFILKSSGIHQLEEAISEVMTGKTYFFSEHQPYDQQQQC